MVLRHKRLALLQSLLRDFGYADAELFSDLAAGFPLIGRAAKSGIWPAREKPATSDAAALLRTAKWAQEACQGTKPSRDPEVDKVVWRNTLEEASEEKGWLIGPLSPSEVTARLGRLWVPANRFGVPQAEKVRNIDDCSRYGTNA